eukprot:g31892.t1
MFLYFTGITGDIEAFKNTSDLVYLDLAATGTTGDIAVFGGTPFLQGLVLYSTNVIGDIKVFQETPSLSHLELWPTKVTGDLKVFEYTPNLWHVVLYSTGVAGDIHVFEEKTYLEELQLGNTGAYGDIQVFQDVPRLQTLNLRSTNVTGDMHQIRLWRDVKTVDLSKTLVSGRIDRAWRGCCQSLQRLNLAESKVSFLPTGNDALELMKVSSSDLDGFLPALTSLDVSRCLLHGELQQLIQPLMECKFLSKIAAAGCNLTGDWSSCSPDAAPFCTGPDDASAGPALGGAEVAYLETLELTVDSWQEWFNIQCFFDPVVIHSASALAAPLLPLLLLGLCAMIELFSRRINLALKMLTLFFIGGASSSAKLLNCQDYDGGGEKSLGEDSFRPLFPHLKCNDSNGLALWVDGIGYATVFAYGMVIPMFLLMVMARQHLALQESRLLVATADIGKHTRALRIERLRRTSEETPEPTTELGAGLKEWTASDEDQADSAVDVSEMLASMVVVQENLAALRSRTVMQMLTERSMLQDEVSDRVVLGAKQLLTKYAMCQHVWMEVALKLVAVALVSVVSADIGVTGLYLALALTLGMAAVIAMVHPYSQPQLNDVQCLCFVSLALSAAGFHYGVPWISRLGLGAPFLLLSVQVFKPDSVEALALRLYEEPFELRVLRQDFIHALVVWFDVHFDASATATVLTTAPGMPDTHWKQTVLYLAEPLVVFEDDLLIGRTEQSGDGRMRRIAVRKNSANFRDLDVKLSYRLQGQRPQPERVQGFRIR